MVRSAINSPQVYDTHILIISRHPRIISCLRKSNRKEQRSDKQIGKKQLGENDSK